MIKKLNNFFTRNFIIIFFYYIIVIFGFLFICLFIYTRFILERLPRNIPFILTEFRFYTLFSVFLAYIYAIKHYVFPKPPHNLISILLNYIQMPFIYFDNFVKTNKFFSSYY